MSVATFNLEYGGENYSPEDVVTLIKQLNLRVVLLQETRKQCKGSKNTARRIADSLGWHCELFRKSDTAIISAKTATRICEGSHFGIVKIGLVYFCTIHLSDYPYIPFEAESIRYPPECATSCEQPCFHSSDPRELEQRSLDLRREELQELVSALEGLPKKAKVVAGGDFNEPSHRDWTKEAAKRGDVPFPINFPVTRIMEELGFVDAYRSLTREPGYTWPDREVEYPYRRDRIDFIFLKNLRPMGSQVVETAVDLSDHAMVMSYFNWLVDQCA
jgi:exonuclease III